MEVLANGGIDKMLLLGFKKKWIKRQITGGAYNKTF